VPDSNRNGATPDEPQVHVAAQGSAARWGGSANGGSAARDSTAGTSTVGTGAAANEAPSPTALRAWPDAAGGAALSPAAAREAAAGRRAVNAAEAAADPGEKATGPGGTAADPGEVPFWDPAGRDDPGHGFAQDEGASKAAADERSSRSPEPVVTPVETVIEEPQREGIGQHLGNLAHLSANPRMRAWQRRAIIAVVVGVAFTIIGSWRLGLTLAVLAAIADTIYRSRKVFTSQEQAGLSSAQRRTCRQLRKLERAGYRAMHCVPIPGSEDQIDHLVVGRAGVFAIDSEAWSRRLPVRTRIGRELWHGPHTMKDRLEHARWESERAAELLSGTLGSPVTVRAAMAVYGPKIPWDVATIRDVDVFSGPRLRKYLRRRARKIHEGSLSASDIERIDKAAHMAFQQDSAS
jgi:uncharacterized membrane protein